MIRVGCDPEVFVKNQQSFVSAFGMIKGDKRRPKKVKDGAVQVDGMALEFNIEPAEDEKTFVSNIDSVLTQLHSMVPDQHDIAAESSADFGWDYIRRQPMKARDLGCDPDFDAYRGGVENEKPDVNLSTRTAAGHVHIGWTEDKDVSDPHHFDDCILITKMLDATLGVPSVILDKNGAERRKMYGKAGAFRPKSYGVEYRVLSNFWIFSEELQSWVYKNIQLALTKLKARQEIDFEQARFIINSSDESKARAFCVENGIGW